MSPGARVLRRGGGDLLLELGHLVARQQEFNLAAPRPGRHYRGGGIAARV